ncbi:MAG: DinB family protein [Bryobacteraceae bacterium]
MEAHRIADQLRRSLDGTAWHGPALRELLDGVSAEQAAARPIDNAHSIWELVLHIDAWRGAAARGLDGSPVDLTSAEDWPAVAAASEEDWRRAIETLERNTAAMCDRVAGLEDSDLERQLPPRNYTVYFLLHGLVQHNLYHAGQIALLKKFGPGAR